MTQARIKVKERVYRERNTRGKVEESVAEKGHLSQTVVMAASAEQANAWRPGREEAVKAMGLVRGMVSSVNQAPSWGP